MVFGSARFCEEPRGFRRRCAFTLPELLVVIGIVAVLIGMLLPALNSARRANNAVLCMTNLRTLGQGFAMYAAEFKGVSPWEGYAEGDYTLFHSASAEEKSLSLYADMLRPEPG